MCIYCGIRPAIESEHVIGNVFYIQRPKQAITVPSCSACNRGRGDGGMRDLHLDEEYMRTILCMTEGCSNHPVVIALLEGNIARSFRRRHRGLRQSLLRSIRHTERLGIAASTRPLWPSLVTRNRSVLVNARVEPSGTSSRPFARKASYVALRLPSVQ